MEVGGRHMWSNEMGIKRWMSISTCFIYDLDDFLLLAHENRHFHLILFASLPFTWFSFSQFLTFSLATALNAQTMTSINLVINLYFRNSHFDSREWRTYMPCERILFIFNLWFAHIAFSYRGMIFSIFSHTISFF